MLKNKCGLLCGMALLAVSLAMVSCGTKKSVADGITSATSVDAVAGNAEDASMTHLRKVYGNEVNVKSISSKIKFTINTGSKDLSVSGSLNMKKDEVIRIQLTPLGLMEVGRLEFAKDYVLLMDRMNKQYVKADYSEVSFLKRNGLDFYTLQALFWNQLFIPGTQKITDSSLKNFSVTFGDAVANTIVSLQRGNIDYAWTTDKTSGQIRSVDVLYKGTADNKTKVTCGYGSFKPVGTKRFPTDITLTLTSDAVKQGRQMSVSLSLGGINTDGDWDTFTKVSGKYKQVGVEDVINRLLKM